MFILTDRRKSMIFRSEPSMDAARWIAGAFTAGFAPHRQLHGKLRKLFGDHEYLWYAINPISHAWEITFSDSMSRPAVLTYQGETVAIADPVDFRLWLMPAEYSLNPPRSITKKPPTEL